MVALTRIAPLLFVFLWSTGFVAAKYSMPNAEPFSFLALRMAITAMVLLPIIYLAKQRPPFGAQQWWHYRHDMVVGFLLHSCYLGTYFWAIRLGADAGSSAIIIGLQPILTSVFALFIGERFSSQKTWGLILGFIGVCLVIGAQTGIGSNSADPTVYYVVLPLISLFTVSAALVYQKKFCQQDQLISRTFVQYVSAAISCMIIAMLLGESSQIEWTLPFSLALLWQVCCISVGAVLLLMKMVNQGEASQVASLFYLVPPLVVLEAFLLFDEQLSNWAMLGMAFAIAGVWLTRSQSKTGSNAL